MTPKQARFIAEYLVDWNGAQAAVRAGYPPAGARQQASRLLTNVDIRTVIEARTAAMSAACEVSASRVILELKRIAFADVRRCFDGTRLKRPDQLDDDTAAAIREIEVVTRANGDVEHVHKLRFADKLGALVELGKRTGATTPDVEKPPEEARRVIFELHTRDSVVEAEPPSRYEH